MRASTYLFAIRQPSERLALASGQPEVAPP